MTDPVAHAVNADRFDRVVLATAVTSRQDEQ
jgi:hypothetical protein